MSITLTWRYSGVGTKTGTAIGNFFADLKTLMDSKAGDANFRWEVQASSTGANPYYLWIRRKDASNGRILIVAYTSPPAGNNPSMFQTAPASNNPYVVWFPNGSAASPSNLSASSGSVSGDDTGTTLAGSISPISSTYSTNYVPFYFESEESIWFGWQNPASATVYHAAAGKLVVDGSDNAYDATWGGHAQSMHNFSVAGSVPFAWSGSGFTAGTAGFSCRVNDGGTLKLYFSAWSPSTNWANVTPSSTDIMTDTTNSKAWFCPEILLGQTKGEGFKFKLRQLGHGPGSTGPAAVYNTSGPVEAARQFQINTSGSSSAPWFTNFKL